MIIATPIVKAIDETDYVIEWPQMLSDAIRTYHYVNIYIEIREQKKEKLNYWKHIMITNLLVHSSLRKWLYSLPFYFFIVLLIVKVIKFKKQSIFVYIICIDICDSVYCGSGICISTQNPTLPYYCQCQNGSNTILPCPSDGLSKSYFISIVHCLFFFLIRSMFTKPMWSRRMWSRTKVT
jgi:hypothetical protein